ncbi:MAG TPA: hypothetical protein PKZ99_11845, partial [Azospirillaceae bacterium]|nr:hypothetical protein [Azospirillaceae bacterium]
MASLSEALSVGLDHYFANRKAEAEIIFGRILDDAAKRQRPHLFRLSLRSRHPFRLLPSAC